MGSPLLGSALAATFMIDLERSLAEVSFWKRYVDDTIPFVEIWTIDHLLSMLNTLHPHIQFTYETEYNFKLAFVDVMLRRDGENLVTTVYRKVTNTDVWTANSWFLLWERKYSKWAHNCSHWVFFFTCHYSKTVWLAENLNEIKITYYEKNLSHIKQKIFSFWERVGNKQHFFLSHWD